MKRWLLTAALLVLACPSLALARPVDILPGRSPIEWRPITQPAAVPAAPGRSSGGVLTAPYGSEALQGARYLGRAHFQALNVDVAIQMRDEAGLLRYAQLVSEPQSRYYRHFLTPEQLADSFGASAADYARAIRYFLQQGLGVQWWRQRQVIRVGGSQAAMERAFQTHFGVFSKNNVVFYAPVTAPRFYTPLPIAGIGGMVNYHRMRRHLDLGLPFRALGGFGPGFLIGNSPFDLAAGFDYTGAYNLKGSCCKGDGITIGIVGTGPISAADVPKFRSTFNVVGTGTVHQVNVTQVMTCCYSTGLQPAPPVTAPCSGTLPACNPEDVEAQLDTEQTSSLAPNATVNFYLAYNPNECFAPGPCAPGNGTPRIGIFESDDELQQIVSDNVADVVSASYGVGELDFASPSNPILHPDGTGADPTVFASLVAEGIAVFFSSGDTGAEGCQRDGVPSTADVLCASYPSSDPSVVSVGGTTTPLGSNGQLTGLVTTWGVPTQTGGAGGGGFSAVFSRPAFEPTGMVCAAPPNGSQCDSNHRLQPDVSLNADPSTGASIIINCGTGTNCAGLGGAQIGSIGGTSASAPDMAAMWALVLEACKQTPSCNTGPSAHPYRLGNPAPLLYHLTLAQKTAAFYDIVYGSNAVPLSSSGSYSNLDPGFNAGPGWDAATGLGAPFARNLIKAIVGM